MRTILAILAALALSGCTTYRLRVGPHSSYNGMILYDIDLQAWHVLQVRKMPVVDVQTIGGTVGRLRDYSAQADAAGIKATGGAVGNLIKEATR